MIDPDNRMSEVPVPVAPAPEPAGSGAAAAQALDRAPPPAGRSPGFGAVPGSWRWAAVLLAAVAVGALALAWSTQQRVKLVETELVKRLQDSATQATEARTLSRQAETSSREVSAKLALVEARVAETTMQRGQLEELIQSLSRSRDENVLADLEAAIRVALQQSAITGSAEPLVLTLRQADERLARYNQPRLERVRRAVAQDLEKTRSAAVSDLTALSIRLDDVIRQVDDLPLLASLDRARMARALPTRSADDQATDSSPQPSGIAAAGAKGEPGATTAMDWLRQLRQRWQGAGSHVWSEVKSLVRVSRIEQPEALLLSPEQAYFLRENLKLRLLNARLSLLSRQFETAQFDLRDAQSALDRYFDRSARRVVLASELLKQTSIQARHVQVPRPDATLAAIATAVAGR